MNKIAIAGTILVDKVNQIKKYPTLGSLEKIIKTQKAVGGLVPNVAIDIKKICPEMQVYAFGKIGDDDNGKFVTENLKANGVITDGIKTSELGTSTTEVMSVIGGERTFFTYEGANAEFGESDIDFDSLKVDMLHLGYFLLMSKLDDGDGEKLLKKCKDHGIKTSIDLISDVSDKLKNVIPCLKYTDNLIINEIEAGNLTGELPSDENIENVAKTLFEYGVKERVIIHKPEYAVCYSENGFTKVNSYKIDKSMIAGTTGAGDAFCSGALIDIAKGKSDREILEFASSCALISLTSPDAVGGLKRDTEIAEFCKNFKRR